MHPSQFQAIRMLVGQLASQLQGAHQTTAQLNTMFQQIGQTQMPQPPHIAQQLAQQAGAQAYMGPGEEAVLDQAMIHAQQQAFVQAQAAMSALSPHMPGQRTATPGFPGAQQQPGVAIPRHPSGMQMPQNAFGVMGPQSPAGSLLDGLGIDQLVGNGGF